jgi:hypothetical protein
MFDYNLAAIIDVIGTGALWFFGGLLALFVLIFVGIPQLVTLMCLTALFSARQYGDKEINPSEAWGILLVGTIGATWVVAFVWVLGLGAKWYWTSTEYGFLAWAGHTLGVYFGMAIFSSDGSQAVTYQSPTSSGLSTTDSAYPHVIDHNPKPFRFASWNDDEEFRK